MIFSQILDGIYDVYKSHKVYNRFKNLIQSNLNYVFKLFKDINFKYDIGNGIDINYNFILRNDNLSSGIMGQAYENNNSNNKPQKNNYYNNNFNDINKKMILKIYLKSKIINK